MRIHVTGASGFIGSHLCPALAAAGHELRASVCGWAPDGGLLAEELYPLPDASHYEPHGLAVGDLDGNGSPDVALADYNFGLVVLRNTDHFATPESFGFIDAVLGFLEAVPA